MQQKRVLILTGAFGDGHNKAAQAIMEAAQVYHPDVEVRVVDYLEWTHPHLHSVGIFLYMQWVTKLPSLYGYLYRKTQPDNRLSHLFKRMKSFRTNRMLDLLDEFRPSEVVSTLPGAASAMSYLKCNRLTSVPTATVMTDYAEHSYWIHPGTDRYLVGAEPVRRALLDFGVPPHRIEVTGIPVRLPFTESHDRMLLRDKHGLDRRMPTVLVMGGGHGLIGKTLMPMLLNGVFSKPLQFIFVCGRNEKLRLKLEEELGNGKTPHSVLVTGFVEHIHELMALSDLILTKPGGLTVSEAMAVELPMLLYKPLPGQEKSNAEYLLHLGAAVQAQTDIELKTLLPQLLADPQRLDDLRRNARNHHLHEGARRTLNVAMETKHHPVYIWEDYPYAYANS
ncbi:MAG: glycosyltransferase [Gorillibacterium sp.]|nr:glycosyltransferase [Gorillibacterium sp.]